MGLDGSSPLEDPPGCSLEKLPLEINQQIGHYVRAEHVPSFYSFASCSKICYIAAIPLLFQFVAIDCRGISMEAFAHKVGNCLAALDRCHARKHVQRLSLTGDLKLSASKRTQRSPPSSTARQPLRPCEMLFASKVAGAHEIDRNAVWKASIGEDWPDPCGDKEDAELATSQCDDKHPVIDLLRALPNLRDLIIDTNISCVPFLNLWSSRTGWTPSCRITIRNQDFDLDASTAGLEHQMAVATSPALHSVSVFCDGPGAYGDHFPLSMVAGGAPHLKEVVFFGCVRTWLPANPVPRLGSLTSLYLCSPEAGDLSHWAEHTDFKSLVSLSIVDYPLCPDDLHWLAGKERFPNLRQLNVQIPMEDTIDEEWCDEEVEAVNTFCKSLPCLEDITLYTDSQAHEIISCVLSRHGDSLKRLHLQDSCSRFDSGQGFTLDTFRNIRDRCPSLQYLRADVHRTFSDCQEAAIYQTISGMRCLRELVLCLKCCYVCWPGYYRDKAAEDLPPHWASYNMEPWPFRNHRATWLLRNGHIRDLLANSAFDESLARSIWDAIYDGGQGVRSLQSLSLHLKDNELLSAMKESPMWRQVCTILGEIKRSFLLQRSVREGDRTLFVGEISTQRREAAATECKPVVDELDGDNPALGSPLYLFRRVWPEKKKMGSKGWRDDWFGLPLQTRVSHSVNGTDCESG